MSGQFFGYDYDNIGNRKSSSAGGDMSGANWRTTSYTANALIEYTSITTPGYKDIYGLAVATNAVKVNGSTSDRKVEYFHREISIGNGSGPLWQEVTATCAGTTNKGGLAFGSHPHTCGYAMALYDNSHMVAMRKFCYHCASFWRDYVVGAPALPLMSWVHRSSNPRLVKGIQVGDPTPETRESFIQLIDHALTLIADCDPVRWRRVQREVQVIINTPSIYTSSYARTKRICMLDLRYFYRPDESRIIVPLLAAELIYQATFGCLWSHRILRTRRNSQRVDSLRSKEAGRFLRRCSSFTDLPAAADDFGNSPQPLCWKRLPQEFCSALTNEPAAQKALWRSLLRRMDEWQPK